MSIKNCPPPHFKVETQKANKIIILPQIFMFEVKYDNHRIHTSFCLCINVINLLLQSFKNVVARGIIKTISDDV